MSLIKSWDRLEGSGRGRGSTGRTEEGSTGTAGSGHGGGVGPGPVITCGALTHFNHHPRRLLPTPVSHSESSVLIGWISRGAWRLAVTAQAFPPLALESSLPDAHASVCGRRSVRRWGCAGLLRRMALLLARRRPTRSGSCQEKPAAIEDCSEVLKCRVTAWLVCDFSLGDLGWKLNFWRTWFKLRRV